MRLILSFALVALLPSCSFFKNEEAVPETSETKPKLVGRIALIPAGADFALIESYGTWRVPEGALLSGAGPEGASTLVVTGEKLGQHAAADIRSGLAKVGDSVYYRPVKDVGEDPSVVESPVPSATGSGIESQKKPTETPAMP